MFKVVSMYSLKSRWLWLILGFAGLVGIFYYSLIPHLPRALSHFEYSLPGGVREGDKSLHFLGYCLATLYAVQLFRRRHHLRISLILVLIGATIEVLQSCMGLHRQPEVLDFLSNLAGACLAWILAGTPFSRILRLTEYYICEFLHNFSRPQSAVR